MCNLTGINFGERMLTANLVAGRDVIEVGALDVNGSLRGHVQSLGPARYLGVDIEMGPGVDELIDAGELVAHYGAESFDVVVTTEMLEHIRNWPTIVSNLKRVLRPGGHLLVTTRSPGFPYHAYPYDFWRYTPDDMRTIFADMEVQTVETDSASPGVFMFARRPDVFAERTRAIELVSIITGRRQRSITNWQIRLFKLRRAVSSFSVSIPLPKIRLQLRPNLGRPRRMWRRTKAGAIRLRNATWRILPMPARTAIKRYVLRRA